MNLATLRKQFLLAKVMNLDGLQEEQVHTLLMLIVLNIIVFMALITKIEAEVALSGLCALF